MPRKLTFLFPNLWNFVEEAEHLYMVSLALSAIYVITFFVQIYGIIGVSLVRSFPTSRVSVLKPSFP